MYDPDTSDDPGSSAGGEWRALSDEVQPEVAPCLGDEDDSLLIRELAAGLDDGACLLHRCRAPNTRGDIDHVIVASSGVWIVDAKSYWGVVERRDVGNWRTVDHRLYVNGRDQTELVENLTWQTAAVRAALDPMGLGDVPIHPVLLFIGSSGRWFSKPIEIDGVRAMWTKKLIEFAREPGPLDEVACRAVAARLATALSPKG